MRSHTACFLAALLAVAGLTSGLLADVAAQPPPAAAQPAPTPQAQPATAPADAATQTPAETPTKVDMVDTTKERANLLAMLNEKKLDWYQKIRALAVGPMTDGSQKDYDEAEKQLLDIKDPNALEPMAIALYTKYTRWRSSFLKAVTQYAQAKDDFAQKLAVTYLSDIAVNDDSATLRGKARAALLSPETPRIPDRLRQTLVTSPDSSVRTRAAELLADLKDKAAIARMIEFLTTEEYRLKGVEIETRYVQMDVRGTNAGVPTFTTVPIQAATPGGGIATANVMLPQVHATTVNTTVSAPAGFKITPDYEMVIVRHPGILTQLERLSGKNFGYDKEAWRQWLAAQRSPEEKGLNNVDWSTK